MAQVKTEDLVQLHWENIGFSIFLLHGVCKVRCVKKCYFIFSKYDFSQTTILYIHHSYFIFL